MENFSTNLNREVAPKPGPQHSNVFPTWHTHTLPNGLTCLIYENHDAELVDLRLVIKSGSINDGEKYRLANLTAKMLLQGTKLRSASEIAEQADQLGIDLHVGAGADRMTVFEDVLTKYLDKGLELLADVVLNPTFLESELDFLRQLMLSQLQASRSDGSSLAAKSFKKAIFGEHPYGNPPEGTEESLNAISTDDLKTFYAQHFSPNNAFIVVAGDVQAGAMIKKIEGAFQHWHSKEIPHYKYMLPEINTEQQIILTHQEGAAQSTIYAGHLGVERNHPDFMALQVMNMILGGYFGSRLNMNIREQKGFTYSVHSGFNYKKEAGDFGITLKVRPEATLEAIYEIRSEVKRLQVQEVPEKELQSAKQFMIGSFHIHNETPEAIASRILAQHFYSLPKDYYQTYPDLVRQVSAKDVMRVAIDYLHPDKFIYSIASNSYNILPQLNKLGDVTSLDAKGNPMTLNS